jgi:hypothetical protein
LSQFSDLGVQVDSGPLGGTISKGLNVHWKATWHVGAAVLYQRERHVFSAGAGYDSWPVDDKDPVAYLPMDEQVKFGASWSLTNDEIGSLSYSLGGTYIWLGKGRWTRPPRENGSRGSSTRLAWFLPPGQWSTSSQSLPW